MMPNLMLVETSSFLVAKPQAKVFHPTRAAVLPGLNSALQASNPFVPNLGHDCIHSQTPLQLHKLDQVIASASVARQYRLNFRKDDRRDKRNA
jgi:hypothetical protein